jgi:beta-lactamase class A
METGGTGIGSSIVAKMKKMAMGRIWFSLCFALLLATTAAAQPDPAVNAKLGALAAAHHGKVAVFAEDLTTGRTVALNADTPVPTASVIKLAVLYEALEQIRAGRAHFEDKLTLRHEDQVEGSGVLLFFDTPMQLTLKDALTMMIVQSDNTATNLVIDHLGLKNIDDRIVSLGLKNTWLYKKVFLPAVGPVPSDQKTYGLGKTTAREMASVMGRFVNCDLNLPGDGNSASAKDHELCDAAMHMLKSQSDRNCIPRYLEAQDVSVELSGIANKTGSLDAVRNDVGAVFTKRGPIVISAFTYDNQDTSWTPDNEGEVLIAKMAKEIVASWSGAPQRP